MRDDLVVPGENEEKFVVAADTRVVTIPFTPLEERMAKEKPYLMEDNDQKMPALVLYVGQTPHHYPQ